MNTKIKSTISSRSFVAAIACILLALLFSVKNGSYSRNTLTNDEVDTIINQIEEAFDLAEEEILNTKPSPDDKPNGPDPDVDKCICKGTGIITHGDGHTTDCPYHKRGVASKNMERVRPRRIFNFFR
tara:strand:+ start:591 stop:971 length:381 start_codon:yes stop_codon:yes gene_type:complete